MNLKQLVESSDDIFKLLTTETTQGVTVADLSGNYIYVNPAFCQMMGYSEQELLQMTVFDMKAPEQSHHSFEQTKSSKEKLSVQVTLQRKDGSIFISEVIGKNIVLSGQHCVLGTVQDISYRVATEQALLNSQQRNEMIMQIANDGIWDWHLDTNIVEFDERYYTIAGYKNNEFPQSFDEWHKRVHPDDITHATNSFQSYLAGTSKNFDIEFRFLCKNNSYMWLRGKGKVVTRDEQGNPLRFIGTHSDITIQKAHEDKIIHQAHFDSLTLLPNRFLSLDRLTHSCNEAKRENKHVALLFLDLDDFKKINDTLGHETGDQLLIDAAQRLLSVVRNVDTVGRLGGDEFVIILSGLNEINEVSAIVDNLLNTFREVFSIKNRELMLTASIGVAIYPNDANSASELLRNADAAMYSAKKSGRNTYSYFTQEMNKSAQRRLAIEEQMHGALARNEFSVHYQPKINISTGKIMGAEALLRWNNPALGNISPDEFISIAEQTGMIIPLGKFILAAAVEQSAFWQKKQLSGFQIAVNLSPRQFRDVELVTFINNCLTKFNVPAHSLELEITEGVLLTGHNYVKQVLKSITRLGIKIAMDDFGTGYSSLSYLRTYPFDVIKIDRSFINGLTNSKQDEALINAVISMSCALDLTVVAEGVETEEQYLRLKQLGCDYAQGYLFSKPLTKNAMTHLLATTKNNAMTY